MSNNFPAAFEERMKISLGSSWQKFSDAHLAESPVSIRINTRKFSDIFHQNVPWSAFGRYLPSRPIFTLDPLFHGGAYYVQEASSMFLEQVISQSVDTSQPLKVLDLCAAPGGKSTHLLSLISDDSLLVSNEVIRSRATILAENIQKWGHANVVITNNDPEDFQRLEGYFDVIVVDAPCSGEGLFRKDAEAKTEWSPDNVALCALRQRRILQNIYPSLKQNGVLIYCTCTYNAAENEDNLSWLQQQTGLVPIKIKTDPSWNVELVGSNGYRFFPHRVQGEGFFITAFRKVEEPATTRIKSKLVFAKPQPKVLERVQQWLSDPDRYQIVLQDELLLAIPASYSSDIEFLSKELKIVSKGFAVAGLKHDKLVPEHAAALATSLNRNNFDEVSLEKENALKYLRKDHLDPVDNRRGFALVTYEGLPLGWVNLLGNRINNLYPAGWRIRMSQSG